MDSGSSHTFLNASMLERITNPATPITPMRVQVANGGTMWAEVNGLEWWIQGHTFTTNARVIELAAYDLILGMDWLEQFSPMTCDWLAKWIEFKHNGQMVRL